MHMWCKMLPAVKIVDLRHVSKEDVLLAVEDGRQKARQSWVLHLSSVSLQWREWIIYANTISINLLYIQQEFVLFPLSPAELRAALPHIFARYRGVPSSRDWGGQRGRQRASLARNKQNHKLKSIKKQHWEATDASPSPLQQIWAVLSLQAVWHAASTLLVIVNYLDLNTPESDATDCSAYNRKVDHAAKHVGGWIWPEYWQQMFSSLLF